LCARVRGKSYKLVELLNVVLARTSENGLEKTLEDVEGDV
jgi:hypothetical protein